MRYSLVYTNRADKDIQKLPPEIKKRIGKALSGMRKILIDILKHLETLNSELIDSELEIIELSSTLKAVKLLSCG